MNFLSPGRGSSVNVADSTPVIPSRQKALVNVFGLSREGLDLTNTSGTADYLDIYVYVGVCENIEIQSGIQFRILEFQL